ncbi:oxygenase [Corynebacterium sp. 4HC-13]|uniref:TauD/TfdA family dioxygenase n=1 Tax=Corynebacterium anserum TaxID=2684406 RepID=UPI00163B4FD7|nr:TauD/TfdA family dioxygenase [Corynebacterium anserum]MBC2681358.1 oxygenase [Corynebacterium anserum]
MHLGTLVEEVETFKASREEGQGAAYTFLSGVPIDEELPPTPTTPELFPDTPVANKSLETIVSTLGQACGYADEQNGQLYHNIRPVQGEETKAENTGSVKFEFHTENVHHPFRPDYLILLGLRVDHDRQARTRVSEAHRAVELLSDEDLETLQQSRFVSGFPSSFTRHDGVSRHTHPHQVLRRMGDRWYLRVNSHTTKGQDEQAARSLSNLVHALESVSEDIELTPGDVVIVDNHCAAHGRTEFSPRYDGFDRWLKRSFAIAGAPSWARWGDRSVFPPCSQTLDSL